jgi:hypothetical protein
VASKKEPKVKAKKARAVKDDPGEAKASPKKPKAAKAPKKATAKGAGKNESKRDTAKQHKIRTSVALDKKNAGKNADRTHDARSKKDAGAELDPFEVAKARVKGSVPAIVDAMVEKAKQGSCTHAKTLLEMTGAKHMFDEGEAQDNGEPWAKLVLERLDEADGRASVHPEAQETVKQ